ncbi:Cof-type HAD-IIB family hydrolase [Novosphingobium sp. 9U]|uniref:Cof-type HAD-IIB family hydrolase n=1 Tax=Novosphingobium sp. 9U TaxID=2653158 RepID=UPI0012EFE309|nr:Cof-type HAD-IIB family hydrolase [Novosphingobium sp. 9U]VWX54534.1 Hydrolase Cof [Novosphingobium sp. 9U]
MTVRLIVSDIDGTLVRHDKTLSDGVVAAVGRAQAAGLAFSLISARPPSGMLWIAQKLGLTAPIGAFNGGTIVQPDGAVVTAEHIDPDIAARVLTLIDQPGVTPWLFADGKWYAQTTENQYVPRERLAANQEPVIRSEFASLTARADKIVAVSDDHDGLAELEARVAGELGASANVVRSQPYYLDVTAPGGNKGAGVTALAAAYGVSLSDLAVFGDQNNDLAMFKVAGYSVAMGQAPDNVRAAASAVAASNEDDGVADAIDRLVLPRLTAR